MKKKQAIKRTPTTKTPDWKQIERLATEAVQSDCELQQVALLTLLYEIQSAGHEAADVALTAKHAVLKASVGLHDEAIESLLALKRGGERGSALLSE